MHQKYLKKISGIRTCEVVDILINLDNGLFDKEVEEKRWYNKLEKFRETAIEVLIRRYLNYYEYHSKRNLDLDRAYQVYLKYYI